MTTARTLQRLVIAEALVQGTRIATIARNLRVSRSWASREANAPQTRVMLASMLNKLAKTIARPDQLFARATSASHPSTTDNEGTDLSNAGASASMRPSGETS